MFSFLIAVVAVCDDSPVEPENIQANDLQLQKEALNSDSEFPSIRDHFIPVVSFSLPVPMTIGFHYHLNQSYSFLLSGGYFPIPFVLNGALKAGSLELQARWHPFQQSFFVSSSLGYQLIHYQTALNFGTLTSDVGSLNGTIEFTSFYLGFGTGFNWFLSERLFLGTDIGVQIPILSAGGLRIGKDAEAVRSIESAAVDSFSFISRYILPRITLLRIGWAFK